MFVLGLTGGIGAGKSTVARMLARRGARVIDADVVVRELYGPGALAAAIAARFGHDVLGEGGAVERRELARIVFADPGARHDLEELVHPAVRSEIRARLAAWEAEGFDGVAVVDAALLVEAADAYPLDLLAVVTASEETRLARLEERGLSREEARRRIAAQIGDSERNAAADRVIRNDAGLEELERAVDALLHDLGRDGERRSG